MMTIVADETIPTEHAVIWLALFYCMVASRKLCTTILVINSCCLCRFMCSQLELCDTGRREVLMYAEMSHGSQSEILHYRTVHKKLIVCYLFVSTMEASLIHAEELSILQWCYQSELLPSCNDHLNCLQDTVFCGCINRCKLHQLQNAVENAECNTRVHCIC